MSFSSLCNEEIHIKHTDGRETGPLKAVFGKGKFTVFDGTLDVAEGDTIDRPLPNGKAERYDITAVHYTHKFGSIPAHVDMTVRKQGALVPFQPARTVNISINNSHGIQVGDHNTQNIIHALQQLAQRIEAADAAPEAKAEVKSRLQALLEHPLTSAIVGGGISAASGLIS